MTKNKHKQGSSWSSAFLGDIAKISSGSTPRRGNPQYWNGNIPWITTSKINYGTILKADEYITNEGLSNSSTKVYPKGTLLMAMYGQGVTRGKVAILGIDAAINQACASIEPHKDVTQNYLYYLFSLHYKAIRRLGQGSNQSNLNGVLIKSIRVSFPNINNQNKIVHIIGQWDRAIDKTQKLIEGKKKLKKALMQKLLTGETRFPKFGLSAKHGELPTGWRKITLVDLGTAYTGLSGKSKNDFGVGSPYIPYLNIFNNSKIDSGNLNYVTISPEERQNAVKIGDIFFTTSSETPAEVGMSSVLLDDIGIAYLNSFCFGFRLATFDYLLPEYARYLFRGEKTRREIIRLAQGATRYNLSKTRLLNIAVPLPPVTEQRFLARTLDAVEDEIKLLVQLLKQTEIQKTGLMQKLLTEKVRVKV